MGVARSSQQMFNLIVSTETLVYYTAVGTCKSLNAHLRYGGGLLEYMQGLGTIENFEWFQINLKDPFMCAYG